MHKSGLTLIELIMVIAILAILAGMTIVPYTYYLRKAKAKELITLSRACLNEAITHCMENSNFNDFSNLPSCTYRGETSHIENIQISISGSCESEISATATGTPKGSDITFNATCTYEKETDSIFCITPM